MSNYGNEKVNVFISHKHEDELAARSIKGIFELYSGDRLGCFISEEIPAGVEYYDWIKQRLVESNLLLLLFTEPTNDWDWCLFEAGLFTRLEGDDIRRVICLHPPNTDPPKPLKHLQAVVTQPDKLAQFLVDLFGTTRLTGMQNPINEKFAHNREAIDRATNEICTFFGPKKIVKQHYNRYVNLQVKDRKVIQTAEDSKKCIPHDAVVESNPRSLEIFGLGEGNWTWKHLENKAREQQDTRWIDQLNDAVHHASLGEIVVKQVQATFQGLYGGNIYRPILYRSDDASDGTMVFHILFVKEVAGQSVDVPTPLDTIQTILIVGTRFRYEVVDKCLHLMERLESGLAIEELCRQVRQAIENIENESASRRAILRLESIEMIFAGAKEKTEVRDMYEKWYGMRKLLFEAMDRRDIQGIRHQINEILKLNNRFMDMASRRHHELVLELMCGGVAQSATSD